MKKQTNIHCSRCGTTIPEDLTKQPNHKCPQCGHFLVSDKVSANHPPKAGRMSQRQLILMMVLLPLLVVAMTVGSWYLIKAYRLPSADFGRNQIQANLIDSNDIYTKNMHYPI